MTSRGAVAAPTCPQAPVLPFHALHYSHENLLCVQLGVDMIKIRVTQLSYRQNCPILQTFVITNKNRTKKGSTPHDQPWICLSVCKVECTYRARRPQSSLSTQIYFKYIGNYICNSTSAFVIQMIQLFFTISCIRFINSSISDVCRILVWRRQNVQVYKQAPVGIVSHP